MHNERLKSALKCVRERLAAFNTDGLNVYQKRWIKRTHEIAKNALDEVEREQCKDAAHA